MITFDRDGWRFNYRTVGIIMAAGRVLLEYDRPHDFWCLPGGRVELGETAAEALLRELREELGEKTHIERLVWVADNFFKFDGRRYHELSFYFLAGLPEATALTAHAEIFAGAEAGRGPRFQWFPLADLPGLRLCPDFLVAGLQALPPTVQYLRHEDAE